MVAVTDRRGSFLGGICQLLDKIGILFLARYCIVRQSSRDVARVLESTYGCDVVGIKVPSAAHHGAKELSTVHGSDAFGKRRM